MNRMCRHVKLCFRFAETIELEPSHAHQNPFIISITNRQRSPLHACMVCRCSALTIVRLRANLRVFSVFYMIVKVRLNQHNSITVHGIHIRLIRLVL